MTDLNAAWKRYGDMEIGDLGNYWQRDDGNAEVYQGGVHLEPRGEGFHLNVARGRRLVYVGTYATLEQATGEADYRLPLISNEV